MSASRELRAPRDNGALLAEPPLDAVPDLLAANERRLAAARIDLLGRSHADLSRQARTSLLTEAAEYLRQGGEPVPPPGTEGGSPRILMAGHQPELFHPGVWVKNFALCGLARRTGATSVNLVVDNDTIKRTAIRVPACPSPPPLSPEGRGALFPPLAPWGRGVGGEGGGEPWPHMALVPFDHWQGEVPYEEAVVQDEALFAEFAGHVRGALEGCDLSPLVDQFWPEVLRQAARTPLIGERIAAARRALERRWGCHNLEVPVSRVCRTEPFAWFVCHLLAELPRFHGLYNACVHDYRRRYGIRSRNHPVPDLAAEDGWLELPLWGWRGGGRRRGRLMARLAPGRVELRAGAERWPDLPRNRLVEAWRQLEGQGYKVRSRALTNTLYARLFLTDLFLHGIGGGKYDELTDALIERFYGLEPPGFLVLSGTLLLPLPGFRSGPDDCRRLAREIRDLRYNPQRHLADGDGAEPALRRLLEEKRDWMRQEPAEHPARRERFRRLRELNELLWPWVADRAEAAERGLARCAMEQRANAVLRRRDYAFVLYPEGELRPFCTRLL